jgi:alkaline phosphatase D
MTDSIRDHAALTRRRFLINVAASAAFPPVNAIAKPFVSLAPNRPVITHGVQSGDVSTDSGVVWARSDRPARMQVEVSTTDSFKTLIGEWSADALPGTDFTAKKLIEGLPPGQDIFYRVSLADITSPTIISEPAVGHFRTAPADRRSVSFVWSGDTAGQGWGIDEDRGGMRTFAAMRRNAPDFFIHSGDSIYADDPLPSTIKLPNGQTWTNIVTEDKSKVAETLAEFRGNYKYNLIDHNVRAFNAEVPIFAQWDDHEVTNDWVPGERVRWAGYTERDITKLARRGNRAFREYMPMRESLDEFGRIYRKISYGPLLDVFLIDMRSYRTINWKNPASVILGAAQLAWLKRELKESRATWKVIAADLPLGLVSYDAVALGDGAPQGREIEIAGLLSFLKREGVRNTVWLTADQHYTAAHYYDPNKAVFQDFDPFWEFVSGPLHAGTWGPSALDNTFGPQLKYQNACSMEQGENLPPCFGLQFFGHVAIDGVTQVMTVTLKDLEDRSLWSVDLAPEPQRWSSPYIVRG